MEELLRELERSEVLRRFLEGRVPRELDGVGCAPSCKWILDDLKQNGRITGWPYDSFGKPDYPIEAKLAHLYIELIGTIPEDRYDDVGYIVRALVTHLRSMTVPS